MEENRVYEYEEGFSLCLRVRERLQDLFEGYLDAMAAESIRAHLNVCYLCNREYRDLEQTVRLIETLPFVEPIKDYTPAIMSAINGQTGYSFQAPVVEVETESVVSQPQSITGIDLRRFRISKFGIRNAESADTFSIRERAVGVFGLVAAFLALLFSPFFPSAVLTEGYGGLAGDLSQVPILGLVVSLVTLSFARGVEMISSCTQLLNGWSLPVLSLGPAYVLSSVYARAAQRRELPAFARR